MSATINTRYLYNFKIKDDNEVEFESTNNVAKFQTFDIYKISELDKRKVYKGTIDDKKDCVVKVYKKSNGDLYYRIQDLLNDLKNFYKAKDISSIFSEKFKNDNDFIKFNYVNFYIGSKDKKDPKALKAFLEDSKNSEISNELNIIENYIQGNFKIFVDEYCEIKYKDFKSIPWFMHWNWVETNGTYLICDLRGENDLKEFSLSSPSLQSKDGSYGSSDNGVYSLITFLSEHEHNDHCKNLPWPDDKHIEIAKSLKNKYSSSKKCDDCEKTYDEIISSAFNSKFNFLNVLIPIVVVIVLCFALFFIIKKYKKNKNKNLNENLNQIENSTLEKEPTGNFWADI